MPELPEIETIKNQLLSAAVIGRSITQIEVLYPQVVAYTEEGFEDVVVGTSVDDVHRKGKYLVLGLDNKRNIVIHFRMNGRLLLRERTFAFDPYTQIVISLDDGRELRFGDSRKFATVELMCDADLKAKIVNKLGPDAASELDLEYFYQVLQSTTRPIKSLLLDQQKIAGIGNIYANEALWWAKIHPETSSADVEKREAKELLGAIHRVLAESIQLGGSSKRWFRHIDGGLGRYQEIFKVYNKAGLPCPRHQDVLIRYSKVGGRGTYHCEICQQIAKNRQTSLIDQ
ncbi:bifunctional DNA-formamidopyrimidine glycosylase/DNA-(apurinic or apyrimidinic site) lyase [candidate division WWE3 bacterium]|uniref:Bifunctional DNA-formamidopyrimidine glycosylase/DNA-(Apurinic or apyrimidinic site) lyase n=1 Tax=candidate division WWE3 bacterium TaxID=2053526 RepID=A0A955LJR0_UNCKA|nr:bifunctional DNA-formamidopyrimidine glycosylase/DNA-(apurinic or apyrimidinic site) lyase [candidate division WWE3 bacterium]